ncbi:MAG: hypothetical protein WCV84_06085 [Patescibacteria group bacterium]
MAFSLLGKQDEAEMEFAEAGKIANAMTQTEIDAVFSDAFEATKRRVEERSKR